MGAVQTFADAATQRLQQALVRVSGGRVGSRGSALLLTTTGLRAGEPQRVALPYQPHDLGYVVRRPPSGSPAWWRDLEAEPAATVARDGALEAVRARPLDAAGGPAAAILLERVEGEPPHPEPHMAAWSPPAAPPLTGRFEENDLLAAVETWPVPGVGPEDVALDRDGRVYTGLEDGRIVSFPPGGDKAEQVADTGGRPLGLEFDPAGDLVVCDARRGLLRAWPDGRLETLIDSFEGRRLRFTNNAAIASDGTIYFSDSSTRFGIDRYRDDLLEHRPNGRLFACGPGGGDLRLVRDGLYFANGVALAPDESFVLVAETAEYRIRRIWLKGERAGEEDVFADNLPGIPDNLSAGPGGTMWLALFTPRNPLLDRLLPRPGLRQAVALLPERLQPQPVRHGFVLGFDADGRVTHNLQDPGGGYAPITGVREAGGWLYLGSLTERAVARVRLG